MFCIHSLEFWYERRKYLSVTPATFPSVLYQVNFDGVFRNQWRLWGHSSQCHILSPHFWAFMHYGYVISPAPMPLSWKVFFNFRTGCSCTSFWKVLWTRQMFKVKLFFSLSLWFWVLLSQSLNFYVLSIGSNFYLYLSNYLLKPSIDKESIDWGTCSV